MQDHLRIGSKLNPLWDMAYAQERIKGLGLNLRQRAGQLSGGQRVELSLTMALAKRPRLLLLDEPVASLDPLARRKLLELVMEAVADNGVSVILSSHLVGDVERVCDLVVMLVSSHLVLSGEVDEIVASHHRLVGPAGSDQPSLENQAVIDVRSSGRQITAIVRSEGPIVDPRWIIEPLRLEDIVLAYMGNQDDGSSARPLRAVS